MRNPVMRIVAIAILLIVSLIAPLAAPAQTPEPAAAHRVTPCPFTLPLPEREGETYECGTIAVPLDHAVPSGATIELMYNRLFATGPEVAPDPVLWLEGGPGASALAVADVNRLITADVRTTRDVVLYDQRGAGFSGYLACGEYQAAAATGMAAAGTPFPAPPGNDAGLAEVYDYARSTAALGFAECREAYADRGVNLIHFTTDAIARDSVLLLDALGYEQATLWGTSYGGRVATVIMRNAPERVRAAVLDSPLPLGMRRLERFATLETEPAANLFAWCAADPACSEAYPDLETRTLAMIAALDASPIPIDHALAVLAGLGDHVDGQAVVRMLTAMLPIKPEIAGAIPRAIADLEAGNPTLALMILSGTFPPVPDRDIPPSLTESSFAFLNEPTDARLALSLAMRTAVLCNDESDATLAGIAAEELERTPSPLRGPVPVRSAITLYAQCRALDTGAEALDPTQPPVAIPVLVLGGGYDATTAPSWAEEAANALQNARFVLVPGAGHATARWSACARDLIDGFIADPPGIMDTGCLAADHPPFVLPDDVIPDE